MDKNGAASPVFYRKTMVSNSGDDKQIILCYIKINNEKSEVLLTMFGGFFDMDKPLWRWIGKIPELIALSFFWYICCIPVITIIPASCALFDAISRYTMMDDKGSFRRFFRTFWKELPRGIPLTILWLVIALAFFFGDNVLAYNASQSIVFATLHLMYRIMILLTVGYLGWLVPLQSRYHNSFVGLHINTMRFFLGRLPGTGAILLTTVAGIILCIAHPYTYCLLIIVPALIAVFHTIPVEKAFQKVFPDDYVDGLPVYTPEQRAAALEISKAKLAEAEAAENEE